MLINEINRQRELNFYSGNPQIQILSGLLYCDESAIKTGNENNISNNQKYLFVPNVPNDMDLGEIFEFFADYRNKIQEARVFKTSLTESYGILIKFLTSNDAKEFYYNYNEKRFSFIDENTCFLKWIADIKFTTGFENYDEDDQSPENLKKNKEKMIVEKQPFDLNYFFASGFFESEINKINFIFVNFYLFEDIIMA